MKKLLIASVVLVAAPFAQADTLYGVFADANYWHTSASATESKVDTDYKNQGQMMLSASLEHPVPLIPNARLRYTTLNGTEKNNANGEIKANNTDAIAYYEVLDNVVSLDLGLGAKRIDGDVKQRGVSRIDLNKTMPMAYASAGAKLPFTGLSAKAELGLGYGKNVKATDALAELKYDFVDKALVDVGAKVGYRIVQVDYDEMTNKYLGSVFGSQVPYKVDFKGPYVGLEVHF
ncbi:MULTISPECIES: TIGR04219 family outer membrane beta-barrel protein [unclassified Acinetobacter]|uniref:TIGR04219 family outer membrane beta-barrel protein n=1 Tax=unclassified Acinetobacter TaxID=196816 RepID=UPI0035B7CABB